MPVYPSSRYTQGTLSRVPDATGTYNLTVFRSTPAAATNYRYYQWVDGDRPDSVAYKKLGDPSLWWAIADINPEILYNLNIPPGTIVRIPTDPVMGQGTTLQ